MNPKKEPQMSFSTKVLFFKGLKPLGQRAHTKTASLSNHHTISDVEPSGAIKAAD